MMGRQLDWQQVRRGAACFGGGAVLAGLRVWGQMQPLAMGWIVNCRGWECALAALGGAVGYATFGTQGLLGLAWCAGALALALTVPRGWRAAGCAAVVAGLGVIFGRLELLRAGVALCAGALGERRDPVRLRLAMTAQAMRRIQRQLQGYEPPGPDPGPVIQQLKQELCGDCRLRQGCLERQRLGVAVLTDPFVCRRGGQAQVQHTREQLRRMQAMRAMRQDYRDAVIQQYGFLARTLGQLAQGLRVCSGRFRVQVSARSRGRGVADGDRAGAFPGLDGRFYVVLCDGMGTGLGAARESGWAMGLIREMLGAGLAPEMVMGSVNSQLVLLDRGGAVTVDLAEIRLDTGIVWLHKWGAGPSWVLGRRRGSQVGFSGPPPGLGFQSRARVSRVDLGGGEVLVMASDGVDGGKVAGFAGLGMPTGDMAERILRDARAGEDDATVIVIRLVRK